jgi:hypothetical protein
MSDDLLTVEAVAEAIAKGIRRHTTHVAWFDGDPAKPRVSSGVDIEGPYLGVRITSALPGSRNLGGLTGPRLRVESDTSTWWDYELNVKGALWTLTAKAPNHQYPGWGRRQVASGNRVTMTAEEITASIRWASGPLDCLVRDHARRLGDDE